MGRVRERRGSRKGAAAPGAQSALASVLDLPSLVLCGIHHEHGNLHLVRDPGVRLAESCTVGRLESIHRDSHATRTGHQYVVCGRVLCTSIVSRLFLWTFLVLLMGRIGGHFGFASLLHECTITEESILERRFLVRSGSFFSQSKLRGNSLTKKEYAAVFILHSSPANGPIHFRHRLQLSCSHISFWHS